MLIVLAPSKDMNVLPTKNQAALNVDVPEFLLKSERLISELKKMNSIQLSNWLNVSEKLAMQNSVRFHKWQMEHSTENSSPAILSYTGEAYRGLCAHEFDNTQLDYSNRVLRILSGLYGVLRPLDLIQEYRLEMGTKHRLGKIQSLCDYWKKEVVEAINKAVSDSPGEKVLVNLASNEYFSSIDLSRLKHQVVTPVFKQETKGELKILAVHAKRARGMMTRFVIENQLDNTEDLKAFDEDGYYFDSRNSTSNRLLFLR